LVSAATKADTRTATKPPTGMASRANRVAANPSTTPSEANPALAASPASAGLSARNPVIDTAVKPMSR
jgi:hypothetical protein